MKFSLDPAFVQIFYHSLYGPHIMTLPVNDYDPITDEFATWAGPGVDSTTMITDLVDKLLPFFPTSAAFDNFRIFTQDGAEAVPFLRKAGSFTSKVGTNSAPGWSKAVQVTISALDSGGFKVRLQLMDAASGDSFDPITAIVPASSLDDLFNEWSDNTNAWSSRQGAPPATFLEYSLTLNEKLRRGYRMF